MGFGSSRQGLSGLFSNQGEKSINFYFIMVSLSKKVLKYGTPKLSLSGFRGFRPQRLKTPAREPGLGVLPAALP